MKGAAARALFIAGAVAVGLFLLRAAPRDVAIVYDWRGSGPRTLAVEIDKASAVVRRAEFRLAGTDTQVAHHVRLTDGDYLLRLTLSGDGTARTLERAITIKESETIVLPLGDSAADGSKPGGTESRRPR